MELKVYDCLSSSRSRYKKLFKKEAFYTPKGQYLTLPLH